MEEYKCDFKALEKEVHELFGKYIDCSICPQDLVCCKPGGGYEIHVSGREYVYMFRDGKPFENASDDDNLYMITETVCPQYVEGVGCLIHAKKAELGLNTCLNFPYVVVGNDLPIIGLSFFCSSIENNWNDISEELDELIEREFIPVKIHYINEYGVQMKNVGFGTFNNMLNNGDIPIQSTVFKKKKI